MTATYWNRVFVEPDYIKTLPGNAYLNARELLKVFGYSPGSLISIRAIIQQGRVPEPSCEHRLDKRACKPYWRVSEVRAFIKTHNKEVLNGKIDATEGQAVPGNAHTTRTHTGSNNGKLLGK